jgi:hypothetical protein
MVSIERLSDRGSEETFDVHLRRLTEFMRKIGFTTSLVCWRRKENA